MTIEVTLLGEKVQVDGSTISSPRDGLLAVHDSTGKTTALFASNEWISAIRREPVNAAAPEPATIHHAARTWSSLADVSLDIQVTDIYGVLWEHNGDLWESIRSFGSTFTKPFGESFSHYGPFTEVLDK